MLGWFLRWFDRPRGDGRPWDADTAIVRALEISDRYALRDFLQAWSEGRWSDCLDIYEAETLARTHRRSLIRDTDWSA